MKLLRWLIVAALCIGAPASAFWQSRDSNYNINVSAGAGLSCSYTPVTSATYNVAYTGATPSASGGTPAYTYSQTGTLPPGFSINTSTGVISGTDSIDSGGATYPGIQVIVTDSLSNTANCGSSFTITVTAGYQGPGDILSGAKVWYSCSSAYTAAFAATGNPVCDVVDTATGLTTCTFHIKSNGFVNPAECNATACAVACSVTKRYDQTGGGNDEVQATLANMPGLNLSGLGGLPTLTCLASGPQYIQAPSFVNGSPSYETFAAVANRNSGTQAGGISAQYTAVPYIGWPASANTAQVSGGNILTATASDANWHFILGLVNGSSNSAINVDGTDATGNAGSTVFTTNLYRTCRGGGLGQPTSMEVAEDGMWNLAPNSTVRNALSANAHTRYGW